MANIGVLIDIGMEHKLYRQVGSGTLSSRIPMSLLKDGNRAVPQCSEKKMRGWLGESSSQGNDLPIKERRRLILQDREFEQFITRNMSSPSDYGRFSVDHSYFPNSTSERTGQVIRPLKQLGPNQMPQEVRYWLQRRPTKEEIAKEKKTSAASHAYPKYTSFTNHLPLFASTRRAKSSHNHHPATACPVQTPIQRGGLKNNSGPATHT